MTTKKDIKSGIIIGITTFCTILVSGVVYAELTTVSSGDTLSSAGWNELVTTVKNIPILTIASNPVKRITSCYSTAAPIYCWGSVYYHNWIDTECSNGLPSWNCIGFLTSEAICGSESDISVITPGVASPSCGDTSTFPNGGYSFWNGNYCWWTIFRASYICNQ